MGGHGGLNILPQKKWNVYNYDNRAIVDKDKKAAATKKKAEYQSSRSQKLNKKMEALSGDVEKVNDKTKAKNSDFILPSLPTQSINLFAAEQQIIKNNRLQEYKDQISAKFIKQQGVADDGMSIKKGKMPWYAQKKGYSQPNQKRKLSKWESIEAKKTDSVAISEYADLETHKKQLRQERFEKQKQESELRERSRQKNYKHKLQTDKKSQIQILRQKRLNRERKQRERALKILKK